MTALTRALHSLWQRNEEEALLSPFWLLLGPASLSLSLILATTAHHYDLIAVGIFGLIASSLGLRRVLYALLLLALAAPIGHFLHADAHLWRLGLECSIGCAFLVTALAIEQGDLYVAQLRTQLDMRESTLQTTQEELTARLISLQERLDRTQQELHETETEKSSILTLNEVIRQTAAYESAELEKLRAAPLTTQRVLDLEEQVAHLQAKQQELAGSAAALRELRKQFDDRGSTLHKARVELFHAETALEGLHRKQELAALEPNPAELHLARDLATLDTERTQLTEENQLLLDLVTDLLATPPRKKKVMKKSAPDLPF